LLDPTSHEEWNSYYQMYANQRDSVGAESCEEKSDILANHVAATLRTLQTSTLPRTPRAAVTPRGPMATIPAKIQELFINSFIERQNWSAVVKRVQLDSALAGAGWAKVSWTRRETDGSQSFDEQRKEVRRIISIGSDFRPPADEDWQTHIEQYGRLIVRDEPSFERVSPYDIFFDPYATEWSQVRWIAQRILMPAEQARSRKGWSPTARQGLVEVSASQLSIGTDTQAIVGMLNRQNQTTGSTRDQFVEVFEFYDLTEGTVCHFQPGGAAFLRSPAPIPYATGHPFVRLMGIEDPASPWGIPLVRYLHDLQVHFDVALLRRIEQSLQHIPKYTAPESVLANPNTRKALESTTPGEIIPIPESNRIPPGTQVIGQLNPPVQDPIMLSTPDMILGQMGLLSSVNEMARGGATGAQSATEAALRGDYAQTVFTAYKDEVERVLSEAATRAIMLAQQFMTLPWQMRIAFGKSAGQVTYGSIGVQRQLIIGSTDITVSVGTGEDDDPTARRQRASLAMQVLQPFVQMGVVDPVQLGRWVVDMVIGQDASVYGVLPSAPDQSRYGVFNQEAVDSPGTIGTPQAIGNQDGPEVNIQQIGSPAGSGVPAPGGGNPIVTDGLPAPTQEGGV